MTSRRQRNKAFLPILKLHLDITKLWASDDLETNQPVKYVEECLHVNSLKIGIASTKNGRRTAQFSSPTNLFFLFFCFIFRKLYLPVWRIKLYIFVKA